MADTVRRITDYAQTLKLAKTDAFLLDQADGTKHVEFADFCKNIIVPEIEEITADFPAIDPEDDLPTAIGKLKKWQADIVAKIEKYVLQESVIAGFGDNPDTEKLSKQVISAALAYQMQQAIDKAAKAIDDLDSDYQVMKREQMAPYGYYGKEWALDDLMALVKAGDFAKFAVGDFFTETTSTSEKIEFEVAGKQSWKYCGDQGNGLTANHIIANSRDCLETTYKYNDTNTNAGGYAASKMPANLEAEANKFSSKLQGYMTQFRRLENNKGGWAWASRRITIPGIVELTGQVSWAFDGWSGGAFNQLPLFVGGNAHILKGRGYQKKAAVRMWYWCADPSAASATSFCSFGGNGNSNASGAASGGGVSPLIVLS